LKAKRIVSLTEPKNNIPFESDKVKELVSGDIFILRKNEVADPVFLEDCEVFIVKTPSVPGDKFIL
jgi:hypothetical protein